MPLIPGTRLGSYEITAPIGAGGMGEVYRARDLKLNRDVALKVLPTSVGQDPDRLARFRREAQVLAALNHPNIAHIHGFEDSGETHALVMELVQGPTLAERLAGGPLPFAESLAVARQIADAMEAAHEQGIIHRDLKPANIKVKDDGTVKVLDFGLAKALGPESSGGTGGDSMNSPTLTARSTQLGMIVGTAAYMSPEQAKGRPVDRRADIWAFGVILYEMITGKRGYEAEDISETLAAVLTREVDWRSLPADTPARLKGLIRDCLVRDPKQRLRDIGDARRTIERLIEGAPDETAPAAATAAAAAPKAKGRALPWFIAGAAVILAGVSTALLLRPAPPTPRVVTRTETQLKDFSALIAISSDSTKLAYVVAGGQNVTYLVLRMLDQFEGKAIPGSENGAWPLFSPDGQWIAYSEISGTKIRKLPLTGGTSTTIGEGSFVQGATWASDDRIVFGGSKGLMQIPAGGGTATPLTKIDASKETAHIRPQFLPGERQVLFTAVMKDGDPQFAVLDLASGTYKAVTRSGINGRYLSSGHLSYVRNGALYAVPFDVKTLTVRGPEVPVVESVSQQGPDGTGDYAVSRDGLLVYFASAAGQGTTLAWADRVGNITPLAGQAQRQWGTGRLSPDENYLANGITGPNGKDIWIVDMHRATPTRVTFGGNNDYPVWTRDSRHIYFSGSQDGKFGIYRAPVDGSAKPVLVMPTTVQVLLESVAPDGRALVYVESDHAPARLMVLDLNADGSVGKPRPLHESVSTTELQGQISPDGKWIAYASAESGSLEIYVHGFPVPGAKTRVSAEGGQRPRWSQNGRELFYWAGSPGARLMSVSVSPGSRLDFGQPRPVFQHLVGTTFDVTPDPNRFLIELSTNSTGSVLAVVTNWFDDLARRAPAKK